MDIATVIGLVATLGLIFYAMADAAGIGAFIEINSIVIVFGGSIAVLLMRSTLPDFINAWAQALMKSGSVDRMSNTAIEPPKTMTIELISMNAPMPAASAIA